MELRKDMIEDVVYNTKTKYREGFTRQEILDILNTYNNIDQEKFDEAMMGNTGMLINGEFITYHCDLRLALYCGVEKRGVRPFEFD